MSRAGKLWFRRATTVLLVLALAALAGLAVLRARSIKGPVAAVDPPRSEDAADGTNDQTVGVYTGFRYTESVAGKILFALSSARTLGLSSGWHEIEGVKLQFFNEGVGGAVLSCDSARFNRETRDARLVGGIHFEFPDGGFVTTERGVFDSATRRFVTETDAVFSGGGAIGRAGRAVYRIEDDVLELEDVVVRLAEGGTLRAPRIVYRRSDRFVDLPLGIRLTRAEMDLDAPKATTTLVDPDGAPESFEFFGGVRIRGAGTPTRGSLDAWAERLAVVRDGPTRWQVAATTTGRWVELTFRAGPDFLERRIQAWAVRAAMGEAGLEGLRADDGVCLLDVPYEAAPRRGSAMRLRLRTADGAPADVEMEGSVVLASDQVEVRGSRARLEQAKGLAMLFGDRSIGVRAALRTSDSEVLADQVFLYEQPQRAEARGDVQGTVARMGLLAGEGGDGTEPLRFAAEVLEVAEDGNLLVLRSGARAWQGSRLLFADEIRYRRLDETLEATGHVRATFPAPPQVAGEAGARSETLVIARALAYDRPARKARFTGDVRYSDGQYVLTTGDLGVVFGDDDTIRSVQATGSVDIVEPAIGRRLKGTDAVWDTGSQEITITGSPAQLIDEQGNTTSAASLTWDRASGRVTFSGGTETIYRPEERP